MDYHPALKRKEILSHATRWVNSEDILLSGISQSQKDKYCTIPLIRGAQSSHIHGDRRRMAGARRWGRGRGE